MAIVASHCRDHLENASTLYVKTSKALPFTLFPPRSLSFRCVPTVVDYPPPLLRVNFDSAMCHRRFHRFFRIPADRASVPHSSTSRNAPFPG